MTLRDAAILGLDVDGVLNNHRKMPNGYCTIHQQKMSLLNDIVERTACKIVIVSAWRYLILREAMKLEGFRHLLATFGASKATTDSIVAVTEPDEAAPTRAHLLARAARWYYPPTVVALDDLDLGYSEMGMPFVKCEQNIGLTRALADRAVFLLSQTWEIPG